MDSDKILLKVAGILDLLSAILLILTDSLVIGIIALVIGIIILSISETKGLDLIDNKKTLIILGIINIPIYLIPSILIFVFIGKLSKYEQAVNAINGPPKKENQESKKIDNLLKLGVLMVIISGMLFATTSWEIITDKIKVIVLILFAFAFLILSILTERKLKLYKTSFMYWVLSIAFYTLSIVAIQYFGIFGSFLTYSGIGSELSYFITYLVIGLFTYISYIKYNKNYLAYLSYVAIIFALYNLLTYLNLEVMGVISLVSLVVLFVNIRIKDNNVLKVFTKTASYILVLFILKYSTDSNIYFLLFATITNFLNLLYLTINQKGNSNITNILNLIFTYILIEIPLRTVNTNLIFDFICTTFYTTTIMQNVLTTSKNNKKLSYIIYTFISFICFGILSSKDPSVSVLVPAIYILFNLLSINNLLKFETVNMTKYTTPIAIFLLVSGILNILDTEHIINANLVLAFSLTSIIYCLINYLKKDDNIYKLSLMISVTLTLLSTSTNTNILVSIISLFPCIYLFIIEKKQSNRFKNIYSYILLLSSIYLPFVCLNIINLNIYLINILFIWVLSFIIVISKYDDIKTSTYFYIAIPLLVLCNSEIINADITTIIKSILIFYILFLLLKYVVKGKDNKNIVGIIGIILSIAISGVLYLPSITLFIYFLTLGIILVIIGYKEEYNSFYIMGMIMIILNIIYELKDLWLSIPAWLYLLVIGLSIIIVTTIIQAKKQK